MKRAVRILFRIIVSCIIVAIVLTAVIVGLRRYNGRTYPVMQHATAGRDKAAYPTNAEVRSIQGTYLNGFHFSPPHRSHPGTVVLFGGSEGSAPYADAKKLADQGYEALALYFFGQPNQRPRMANVPLDQYTEIESYIKTNITHPTPITVIGSSRGAEFSAQLASHGFPIDNLVNYAPTDRSYPGEFDPGNPRVEYPPFTYQGMPVPFAGYGHNSSRVMADFFWDRLTGRPMYLRPMHVEAASHAESSSAIRLGSFQGNAVFFAGDQDHMWQSEIAATRLAAQSGRFKVFIVPDAGHVFSENIAALGNGWQITLGGTAEGSANALRRSDHILSECLAEWHGSL